MPLTSPEQSRVTRKCHKACERCRTMKVKCSGTNPCTRCARRKRRCHYAVEESRVSVPESYLRELERRSSPVVYNGVPHQTFVPGEVLEVENYPPRPQDQPRSNFSHNPLVEYSFAKAPDGKFWYMGPSSSWSFCRRVLALLGEQVPEANNHPPDPWHMDGTLFTLKWRPLPVDEMPDLAGLPPMDHGLYLIHTAHFYFGPLFYIIDEVAFIRSLHEFYTNPEERVASMRLWFAQYLLIIAFGKAFLAPNRLPNAPPDGYQYASRAMALMPDMSGMNPNPLQCVETLTLAAIYLQSVDMRISAFQHIGHALRICIIEGIHRHVPEHIGEELSRRCKTIFWIVYMLDREFAALIGAPSSIRDEDITVKLFVNGSVDEKTLTLHVRLARLSARILTTVYGVGADFDGTLISDTQSIFRNLAELSQDLNDLLRTHFHGSLSRASRAATRLILAYHHCVVLTTRPLVMCALHAHIENTQTPTRNHSRTPPQHQPLDISLSPIITSLLTCCVESALTVLQTLRTLADEDRIEAFLPFQIEDAFASAFLLYIIRVIAPSLVPDDHWVGNADFVLEKLVIKGNLTAPLRRAELDHLKRVMGPFITELASGSGTGSGFIASGNAGEGVDLAAGDVLGASASNLGTGAGAGAVTGTGAGAPEQAAELDWDIFSVDATVGLEPRELLDLAEQLDVQGIMHYSVS